MEASETVFKPAWWGPGLKGVRPNVATYGQYDYEHLPTPPGVKFDGAFTWLKLEPILGGSILELDRCDVAGNFRKLAGHCEKHLIVLPPSFTAFFADPDLSRRIRSSTACYLDLPIDVIASPKGGGHIIRFFADQQGCIFWYLYLPASGSDHCVIASTDYFGSDAAETGNEPADPDSLVYCAPSIEAFWFRTWLETEYWFTSNGYGAPSSTSAEYLRSYGWSSTEPKAAKSPKGWLRRLFG